MNAKIEDLLLNPRPGTKAAAAKEFGIDLTLLVENLRLTPQARLDKLQSVIKFHDEIRKQGELSRKSNERR